ncbi:hypothetical protein [Salinivibrio socompensis]|uniref:hypothetical protein n=1 Tax=Salinivibrio socompensis TaxID=1510206 RepID=UPI0004B7747D|nr:hypothetical protein [Salinivibrio socompensis]
MVSKLIDLLGVTGFGLLSYGCWLAWQPLGFIVPGMLLLIFAIKSAPASDQNEKVSE